MNKISNYRFTQDQLKLREKMLTMSLTERQAYARKLEERENMTFLQKCVDAFVTFFKSN